MWLANEVAFGALLHGVEVGEFCIEVAEAFVVLRGDDHVSCAGGLGCTDPLSGESGFGGEFAGETLVLRPGNGLFFDGPLLTAAEAAEPVVDEDAVSRFAATHLSLRA